MGSRILKCISVSSNIIISEEPSAITTAAAANVKPPRIAILQQPTANATAATTVVTPVTPTFSIDACVSSEPTKLRGFSSPPAVVFVVIDFIIGATTSSFSSSLGCVLGACFRQLSRAEWKHARSWSAKPVDSTAAATADAATATTAMGVANAEAAVRAITAARFGRRADNSIDVAASRCIIHACAVYALEQLE